MKKEKKIFKGVQQWGKVLEPGTETASGIRSPCLLGIHSRGPSEEMQIQKFAGWHQYSARRFLGTFTLANSLCCSHFIQKDYNKMN